MSTEKRYFEVSLPESLQHDIDAYQKALDTDGRFLDCLWGELYGSINGEFYNGTITEEQADYLRRKYLFADDYDKGIDE